MTSGWTIFITVILSIIGYSTLLILVSMWAIPKLSSYYLYYFPFFKFTGYNRLYYVARQLGVEIDDLQVVSNGVFLNKKDQQVYSVKSFHGILLLKDGEIYNQDLLNNDIMVITKEIEVWEGESS